MKEIMGILLHIYEQMICFYPLACLDFPHAKPLVGLVSFCRIYFLFKVLKNFAGKK